MEIIAQQGVEQGEVVLIGAADDYQVEYRSESGNKVMGRSALLREALQHFDNAVKAHTTEETSVSLGLPLMQYEQEASVDFPVSGFLARMQITPKGIFFHTYYGKFAAGSRLSMLLSALGKVTATPLVYYSPPASSVESVMPAEQGALDLFRNAGLPHTATQTALWGVSSRNLCITGDLRATLKLKEVSPVSLGLVAFNPFTGKEVQVGEIPKTGDLVNKGFAEVSYRAFNPRTLSLYEPYDVVPLDSLKAAPVDVPKVICLSHLAPISRLKAAPAPSTGVLPKVSDLSEDVDLGEAVAMDDLSLEEVSVDSLGWEEPPAKRDASETVDIDIPADAPIDSPKASPVESQKESIPTPQPKEETEDLTHLFS